MTEKKEILAIWPRIIWAKPTAMGLRAAQVDLVFGQAYGNEPWRAVCPILYSSCDVGLSTV